MGVRRHETEGMDAIPETLDAFLEQQKKPRAITLIEEDILAAIAAKNDMINVCDELRQIGFTEALALLLKLLEETITNVIGLCKEQVQLLIERFVETLPRAFRDRLLLSAPMPG
jgi:hypothetical protein